jgi:hypothetical protein
MTTKHKKKGRYHNRPTSLILALVIGDCNTGSFFEVDKLKIPQKTR